MNKFWLASPGRSTRPQKVMPEFQSYHTALLGAGDSVHEISLPTFTEVISSLFSPAPAPARYQKALSERALPALPASRLTWPPCITRLFVTVNPWLFQGGQPHMFFSVSAAPFIHFCLKKWTGSSKFSPVITLSEAFKALPCFLP